MLLVALLGMSSAFAGEYRTNFELPGSESQAAIDLLKDRGVAERTGFSGQIVFKADQGVNDAAVRRTMEDLFGRVGAALEGDQIVSPYATESAYQIAKGGKVAYAELNLSDRRQEQYLADGRMVKALAKDVKLEGLRLELGGDIFAESPQFSSEAIGLFAAIVILLIAFGSLLAMGLPIVTALFGIGTGFALIGLVTRVLAVPDFTSQVAAMIGIGVGIDYALIIVTRYRQGLHDGLEPRDAVILSVDTSGRAVVFAGLTVVISLLGMFMMNLDFIRSVAVGASLAVLMTMLAATTLLPAFLGFVGRNIDRLRLPDVTGLILRRADRTRPIGGAPPESDVRSSFWYRWSRVIQAHPWPALITSTTFLVVLAIPVFSLRLGFSDAGNRAETDTTRRAYDLLSEGFGPGFNAPLLLVVNNAGRALNPATVEKIAAAARQTDGVASVAEPAIIANANLALIYVFPASAPQDRETTRLVHLLRKETLPPAVAGSSVKVYTGGYAPIVADFSDYTAGRLPVFFGAVLLLSFLLLLSVFHSIVVPLKAVIMNMLSIGASFGAMVAVFQWGVGASLIGIGKEGPVEAWAPMMLFAIVFGLSMDYEVFLLTRVREEYDRSGDNGSAVADGLAATGRVISAAAAIMVCVFGSFMLGEERAIKLLGFGLSSAVLIDATVVRLVLVPAAMELMGKANWWAPSWLVRYLPNIRVDTVERGVPEAAPGGS